MAKLSSEEVNLAITWVEIMFSVSFLALKPGLILGLIKGGPASLCYTRSLFVSFLALTILCNNFIRRFIYFVFLLLHLLLACKPHKRARYLVCHIHHCVPVAGT